MSRIVREVDWGALSERLKERCDFDADFTSIIIELLKEEPEATEVVSALKSLLAAELRDRPSSVPAVMKAVLSELDAGIAFKEKENAEAAERKAAEAAAAAAPLECAMSSRVAATFAEDPRERKEALGKLCPCRVKASVNEYWARIFAMTKDADPKVRYQALHNMCDGSPRDMEAEVIEMIQSMQHDEDTFIRRQVSRVLVQYRKTGKWNVL